MHRGHLTDGPIHVGHPLPVGLWTCVWLQYLNSIRSLMGTLKLYDSRMVAVVPDAYSLSIPFLPPGSHVL